MTGLILGATSILEHRTDWAKLFATDPRVRFAICKGGQPYTRANLDDWRANPQLDFYGCFLVPDRRVPMVKNVDDLFANMGAIHENEPRCVVNIDMESPRDAPPNRPSDWNAAGRLAAAVIGYGRMGVYGGANVLDVTAAEVPDLVKAGHRHRPKYGAPAPTGSGIPAFMGGEYEFWQSCCGGNGAPPCSIGGWSAHCITQFNPAHSRYPTWDAFRSMTVNLPPPDEEDPRLTDVHVAFLKGVLS